MPRNAQTHVYITLGFRRDLAAWKDLQAEAQQREMSVPRLIKLILVDRANSLRTDDQALPSQRVSTISKERGRQDMAGSPTHRARGKQEHQDDDKEERHIVTHNAAAAAAFWDDTEGTATIT